MGRSLWWVRRDLGGFSAAARAAMADGECRAVFVVDQALPAALNTPRGIGLRTALEDLRTARLETLGSSATDDALVTLVGDPCELIPRLARGLGVRRVHVEAEATPFARRRDDEIRLRLAEQGCELLEHPGRYLVTPGTLLSSTGRRVQGFSNFYRRWSTVLADHPVAQVDPVDLVSPLGVCDAAARWAAWSPSGLAGYATHRDLPAVDGTSRLSVALRLGLVDLPGLLLEARAGGAEAFVRELAFRDFFADLLWHHPGAVRQSIDPRLDRFPRRDAAAPANFARWAAGETGYPIVDAGMRQLRQTGWMHNRVRMIVASFLVKDLHLPWQWGAEFFLQHLLDGDVASNTGNWQWVAGAAPDGAPFFRIMNPVLQSEKFDPEGSYIRTWVPELVSVPGPAVHDPSRRLGVLPAGYPAAMVDHAEARRAALARDRDC